MFRDPIEWEQTLPIRPSSPAWCATVKAVYGSPLTDEEHALFLELSGGREPPEGGTDEILAVVGRRGGKSETIARIAVFEGIYGGHAVALAPGQIGIISVISPLREQSQEILGYSRGLAALPQVRRSIAGEPTREGVRFVTGLELRVMTADSVNVSGPTQVVAILDEMAKLPGADAVVPDRELLNSLRPALAPVAGAPRRRLIGITSAYIKEGLAFETDQEHFGKPDSPVLVVRGTTEQFNPNIDRTWLDREHDRVGAAVFAREYEGVWQDAITNGWFPPECDGAIQRGELSIPLEPGAIPTIALDASSSERGDKFGWGVCSSKIMDGRIITTVHGCGAWTVDRDPPGMALRVRDEVCARYGTRDVIIDNHAAREFASILGAIGVKATIVNWTAGDGPTSKLQRYKTFRMGLCSRTTLIPDSHELIRDLYACRGILLPGGGERVEVPRRAGSHGDVLSAVVLAASCAPGVAYSRSAFQARAQRTLDGLADYGWGDPRPKKPISEILTGEVKEVPLDVANLLRIKGGLDFSQ